MPNPDPFKMPDRWQRMTPGGKSGPITVRLSEGAQRAVKRILGHRNDPSPWAPKYVRTDAIEDALRFYADALDAAVAERQAKPETEPSPAAVAAGVALPPGPNCDRCSHANGAEVPAKLAVCADCFGELPTPF